LDEIDSPILELTNGAAWKQIVDKNKSAARPTKPRSYEVDSSFYFTVDFIAVS